MRTKADWLASIKHDGKAVSGKPYEYKVPKAGVNSTDRITAVCPDHGKWTSYAFSMLTSKCRACAMQFAGIAKRGRASHRKFSILDVIAKSKEIHKDLDYGGVIEKEYETLGSLLKIRCTKHDKSYPVKAFTLIYDKARGCTDCYAEASEIRFQDRSVAMKWQWDARIKLLGYKILSYGGSHAPTILECKEHGSFDVTKAYYVSQGWSICPACRKGASSPEVVLKTKLNELGYRVELHRRDILKGNYEIDIYLPEHKVAIEVNGVFYHNTEIKSRMYHASKQQECSALGITLLSFTDLEVESRLPLILSMIKAKTGNLPRGAGARKTKVREIDSHTSREFLYANHLQGFCGASKHLGLFYSAKGKEVLVSVASFSTSRFGDDSDWELIRFATKIDTQIAGGLTKLVKNFLSSNPGTLSSYANLRYSIGGAYASSGFRFLRKSAPGYFWINRFGEQLSRYQTQRKSLESILDDYDPDLSQAVNMKNNGYWQVWDCGNAKYLYNQ